MKVNGLTKWKKCLKRSGMLQILIHFLKSLTYHVDNYLNCESC